MRKLGTLLADPFFQVVLGMTVGVGLLAKLFGWESE
jgi:hypothetical protein